MVARHVLTKPSIVIDGIDLSKIALEFTFGGDTDTVGLSYSFGFSATFAANVDSIAERRLWQWFDDGKKCSLHIRPLRSPVAVGNPEFRILAGMVGYNPAPGVILVDFERGNVERISRSESP